MDPLDRRHGDQRHRGRSSPRSGQMNCSSGGEAMPKALVNGVQLFYEEVGQGLPLVFVHEFAGDHQS